MEGADSPLRVEQAHAGSTAFDNKEEVAPGNAKCNITRKPEADIAILPCRPPREETAARVTCPCTHTARAWIKINDRPANETE